MMIEKRYEIRANKDGSYWLFDNKYDSVLIISKIGADLINICTVLNEQDKQIKELIDLIIDKVQYHEDHLEEFLIKKGIIDKDWARFDDYD